MSPSLLLRSVGPAGDTFCASLTSMGVPRKDPLHGKISHQPPSQIFEFHKGNGFGLTNQETESERPMGTTGALAGSGTFSRAEADGRMRRLPADGTLKDGSSALVRLHRGLSP